MLSYCGASCKNLAVSDAFMRLQATLHRLKILNIHGLCEEGMEEVLHLLCLLRSSPNLRKLAISIRNIQKASTNPFLRLLESGSHMDFSLNQLQEVELELFYGSGPEVELVKLLLAKSLALKTMRVKLLPMNGHEQLKLLRNLNRFRRASPEAEIIC